MFVSLRFSKLYLLNSANGTSQILGIDQVNFSSLFSNKMFHVAGAKIIRDNKTG